MKKRIWITWETQRRSIELSKQLNCELFIIEHSGLPRYFKSIKRTLQILISRKPDILFVQNPSMILAFIACTYKIFSKTTVVVDRHTTFQLNKKVRPTPLSILFRLLHYFTVRTADLTIVTNIYLAKIVKDLGGKPFVLQDKLPEINCSKKLRLKGKKNVLLISSFGKDEPIEEVLLALQDPAFADIILYISGNFKKLTPSIREMAPPNVIFTGFIDETDFIDLLCAVDAVMALTTSMYCMLCGCYEAVSSLKPLITSKKKVLQEYFTGAVFVSNTSQGIASGLKKVLEHPDFYKRKIELLNRRLQREWCETYHSLEVRLAEIPARRLRS